MSLCCLFSRKPIKQPERRRRAQEEASTSPGSEARTDDQSLTEERGEHESHENPKDNLARRSEITSSLPSTFADDERVLSSSPRIQPSADERARPHKAEGDTFIIKAPASVNSIP
eukprot:TRINITY_DN5408_c0_g1_i2.p1 TRINITY_DN5408_c0_g1~~TRINITY_DN5408_c0_g1_i2.p1  ORF type:complete len:115 (+),score=32.81 TRINITY_DN5408_c0_g1_i2:186-530(+)